ncbi:MAG: L-threonine 3-dehydrogenase, partial [Thermoanaerobaculia bacterium]|nr:L-threonine 3-dehydrogenase [Thermoanaerobaculia bacterium]
MKRVLVTGALGQIGTELVGALEARPETELVVASDIRVPSRGTSLGSGPFEQLDCTHERRLERIVERHRIDTVFHLAALLSAVAEEKPQVAWRINMEGLYNVLETARGNGCAVFFPSSIGAFGGSTPTVRTPQVTIQRPSTMYGITKLAGELLCDYYHERFDLDTRGLRFPGLISHSAPPGGGTTDYAVEIFYSALRHEQYTSFLSAETRLDMMYMPDAIKATIDLMTADAEGLENRNAYNVTAMNFTPEELGAAIRRHLPGFRLDYDVDPTRQAIADSWPDSLDDSCARQEWGWRPDYDLDTLTRDMLERLSERLGIPIDPAASEVD